MADAARRKEKQRLKRKQKQIAARKSAGVTALQKIASAGGTLECWVNDRWQDQGMAGLFVLGHTAGGRHAFAGFLIDVWCVGLKDAWGQAEISRAEFMERLFKPWSQRMHPYKLEVPEARRLVAAGVRFARQNGFRLPNGWEKWASILGDLGDVASADLTGFTKDGKLLYIGNPEFLRQRLVGCTVEEFFSRPGQEWISPPEDLPFSWADVDEDDELWDAANTGVEDDEEDGIDAEEAEASIQRVVGRTTQAVRQWCESNGVAPHPRMEDAAAIVLVNVLSQPLPGDAASRDAILEETLKQEPPETREDLRAAIDQIAACLGSYKSPAEAFKSLGIGAD
ncbi:MAG: hypothetical protein JWM97_1472 [Phycisphaerales bacterium]|nr:hypothetical protein [Phycisphaerales bacterium]